MKQKLKVNPDFDNVKTTSNPNYHDNLHMQKFQQLVEKGRNLLPEIKKLL